jgi:succinyl-CoA synthetase beta subunit
MPRRKISEHRSKILLSDALNLQYVGWSVDAKYLIDEISGYESYVVKVDQAIKGRFKKGLVLLNVKQVKLRAAIDQLFSKGYDHLIIEPHLPHASKAERYLSINHNRNGYHLSYSIMGGIEIESHLDSIQVTTLDEKTDWLKLSMETKISQNKLQSLLRLFIDNHFVFLEINPYVSNEDDLSILDAAIEVDDAGGYFTQGWSEADIRSSNMSISTSYEKTVHLLDSKSPASFNLSVLNPNGAIFLLLSGGGASVVVADEVFNRGFGSKLANYGEYSGNPTSHEAYIYTAEVLKLLITSSSAKKVLFIGGAVANFTDIASTFAGVIKAITEYANQLNEQKVKVFVRRGGPRQEIGLAKMQAALEQYGLYGGVYDPTTSITSALDAALEEIA